jgi:O-methyltransferase domain/Dimerisation domain
MHDVETPTVALRRLVNGYQVTQAIHVAAALGIADRLRDGPRDSDALARETESHAPSLHRVLRALAAVGVLHEGDDGRFALTAIGECLRSDAPEPVGGWAAFVGRPYHFQAWSALLHGVRTGESPFRSVHGTDVWDYRASHPEEGAIFNAAMTDVMRRANAHLLAAYDFGRFATVVDVGGGRGAFLRAALFATGGFELVGATHSAIGLTVFEGRPA